MKSVKKPLCAVCGKEATPEDRCQDGTYLHLECARATQTR